MKRLLQAFGLCVCSSVLAHADLVITEKVESPTTNGDVVVKTKGDRVSIQMENARLGKTTLVKNFKSGDTTMLIHSKKLVMQIEAAQLKATIEARRKVAGIDPTKAVPKSTGEKEKVGDWDCEIYTFELGTGKTGKLWVAKSFPNYDAIKEQMEKIETTAMADAGFDPEKFKLGGVIVQIDMELATGKAHRTLTSVKEESVADSEFDTPADYQPYKAPAK